ncbi:MAG: hypothetical protein E7277_03745, partial [Lachnospiraceae bacterium]|nr:hypothetical protein [Lachnospiraceae bacterium]
MNIKRTNMRFIKIKNVPRNKMRRNPMKRKKLLSVLLSAAMVASMAPMNVAANGNDAQRRANLDVVKLEASKTHEAHRNFDEVPKIAQDTAESATNIKPNEMVTVIIDYEKEPILEKVEEPGEYENYAELVADNKAEVNAVEKTVETVTDKIEAVVKPNDKGEEPETLYEYTVAFSGSAMKVAYKDIKKIKKVPGVHEVYLSQRYAIPKLQEVKDTPNMLTSRDMMHVTELQEETGFTGRGSLVAVLDTGVAYEHDAFAKRPKSLALDARGIKDTLKKFDLTAEKNYAENTRSKIKQLCASGENVSAEEITKGLDNGNVYKSDKIPFGYDYSNHDSNPTPTNENNHGTHVAGTVAADCDEITGVAPEAQIAAMKVFRDDGYAYQEELMAALQDCVMIGVDSVNMSLGSSAGFTKVENSELQTAYENVGKAGINLNISAGNNYTSAYGSNYGNYTLAENPDEGVVGTPSTLEAALSVAAIENTNLGPAACIQVGDTQIGFHDNGVGSGMGFDTLGAGTFEIVDCGLGKANEFPENVEGKIALVSRGEISFADKDKNAFSAGAIGLIVYNNQSGSIGMSIDTYYIPAVSILKSEGEFIKETMVDGVGTISYDPAVKMNLENPDAYKICEFSSWGTTPDLTFKPEITAPGGNIWSAYYVEDGVSIYGSMSGTSMAAPHMAGAAAVMKQYVNESTSKSTTNQEKRQLINALEMSTAAPVEDEENGTFYSPRCQGAGLVNLKEATSTPAYLSVTGNEKPAAALGYNTDGEFSYTVTINRFSQDDDALKYQVKTTALTEDVLEEDGKKLAAQYDIDITDAVEITYEGVDEDGYVTLPEGEDEVSFTVNLKVNKDAPELAEVVEAFENGFFVEGFTQLFNEDASDLSVPFMGFCGDWAKVPMFDKTQYEEGATFNSGTGLVSEKASWFGSSAYPLGVNWFKYLMDDELEYDEKYAVLSDHSALGTLDNVYPNTYLLRGAAKMDIDLVNEKGETVESFNNENVRKTYYNFSSGNLLIAENFMDELPYVENTYYNPMEEGTYQYVMSALPGGVEDTEENRQVQRLTFHVDNTDPVVKSNTGIFVGDNGNLWMELECEDN